jgi:ornithine cyclodeaminase/alanine dehydrogenase-like protein (mu-crystallin family)
MGCRAVRAIEKVYVFDINEEMRNSFAERLAIRRRTAAKVEPVTTSDSALAESDVVALRRHRLPQSTTTEDLNPGPHQRGWGISADDAGDSGRDVAE